MDKILLVDDQPGIRQVLSDDLGAEGYVVRTAGCANEVSGCLRGFRADLVLLDLFLDGPQGWDVLQEIKQGHPDLPVVIFTAYDSYAEDPKLSLADGYVVKSSDLTELKTTILRVLENRNMEPSWPAGTPALRSSLSKFTK